MELHLPTFGKTIQEPFTVSVTVRGRPRRCFDASLVLSVEGIVPVLDWWQERQPWMKPSISMMA